MMKLHIGCGEQILKGYTNLDYKKGKGVDVVWNLNKFPWPFKDDSVTELIAYQVIEHLDDAEKVFEEIYRICKHNAIVKIEVPHHASGNQYIDITHKQYFNATNFINLTNTPDCNRRLASFKFNFELDLLKVRLVSICKFLEPLINKMIGFYDYSLCYMIRPTDIVAHLKVKKK